MKALTSDILDYLRERGWDKLLPGDIAKSVMIEGSELLEVFQWQNPTMEALKRDEKALAKVKDELGDVMIYCIEMVALLGLDAESVIREKLEKTRVKYPLEVIRESTHLQDGTPLTESLYWKMKMAHREARKDDKA